MLRPWFNTLTVTITGDTDASDILALDDLSYVDTIVTSSVDNIDGTAADVKEALDILGDGAPEHFGSDFLGLLLLPTLPLFMLVMVMAPLMDLLYPLSQVLLQH